MEVNIHHAKTHLSRLIQRAEQGEEVIIARAGKPAVRLTPIQEKRKSRVAGALKGKIWISDDFDAPETNKEIEDLFYNSEIWPSNE